jgi:molybdenum cofactor biosynthesis enzyme MoaA
MKLEEIGFYTLSDERAENISATSSLKRCELILTDKCNFNCPYCRGVEDELKGDMELSQVLNTIDAWTAEGLENIRFSGGEPTLYPYLPSIIDYAK